MENVEGQNLEPLDLLKRMKSNKGGDTCLLMGSCRYGSFSPTGRRSISRFTGPPSSMTTSSLCCHSWSFWIQSPPQRFSHSLSYSSLSLFSSVLLWLCHNLRDKFVPPKKHIILWEILQDEITNILNGLVEKNIFGRLQNEQTVLKRLEEFKKQFAAPTELDLVAAIQNYLRAEPTRQLYRELEECAYDEGKVPSKSQMRYFSRDVVKRLMVRAGHRPQLYGEAFTRELFMKALADGPAKNPCQTPQGQRRRYLTLFVANCRIFNILPLFDANQNYCRWPTLRGTVWL